MHSDFSLQLSPGLTFYKNNLQKQRTYTEEDSTHSETLHFGGCVCVCVCVCVLMWCRQHTLLPAGLARGA